MLLRWGVLVAALLLGWRGGAWAHEAHRHAGEPTQQDHLAAMEAVKERVPAELRSVLEPPVPAEEAGAAAAARAYGEHCAPCHGEGGRGDGPAGQGLPTRPADFLDPLHGRYYSPGERFWIITHGIPELGMPAFGETLDEATRWGLVRHLLRLSREGP